MPLVGMHVAVMVPAELNAAYFGYLARQSLVNREQLEKVLSNLGRAELRALFDDEVLDCAIELRT